MVYESGGLLTEAQLPYQGRAGWCAEPSHGWRVTVPTPSRELFYSLTPDQLRAKLLQGSVHVNVFADEDFGTYSGAIYQCKSTSHIPAEKATNHAMVLVGYNFESHPPYWIVRNSWGTDRGLNGYWLVKAGVNMCGIESNFPAYPIL